jgi:hypothetical protein
VAQTEKGRLSGVLGPTARGHHEHNPKFGAIPRQVNTVIIVQFVFTQAFGYCTSYQVMFPKLLHGAELL